MKTFTIKNFLLAVSATALFSVSAQGQTVGIGEATPNSKLDVLSTNPTGNALELRQNATGNGSSAAWIINNGIGRAINVQSLNTGNNIPAVQIDQDGTGNIARGLEVGMDAASTAFGVAVFQAGSSDALLLNGSGAGWGMYNLQTGTGGGTYNDINGTGFAGTVNDLSANGGIGSYTFFNGQTGTGFIVDSIGGDGWGMNATVRTATPTTGGTVFGAVLGGNQYGNGHGALVNHYGPQGRSAEFNIQNAANTDPAIFAVSTGSGGVVVAQNQNNNIPGTITVGDFAYTGIDVADHIGLRGFSAPAPNWGIGVEGAGNWYGVHGQGGFYATFASGNTGATGTKAFLIDHPDDPANTFLRHFSIESNEVLNVYRGIAKLDANGEAVVELPDYFETINRNFSYQLTPIGTPQQPYVSREVQNNSFVVGGAPNSKVSWMVLAERNDPYLQQKPEERRTEFAKPDDKKGKYLMPELYGQPEEMRIGYHGKTKAAQANRFMNDGQQKVDFRAAQQEMERRKASIKPFEQQEKETAPIKE
jgi:hypothetical protein